MELTSKDGISRSYKLGVARDPSFVDLDALSRGDTSTGSWSSGNEPHGLIQEAIQPGQASEDGRVRGIDVANLFEDPLRMLRVPSQEVEDHDKSRPSSITTAASHSSQYSKHAWISVVYPGICDVITRIARRTDDLPTTHNHGRCATDQQIPSVPRS